MIEIRNLSVSLYCSFGKIFQIVPQVMSFTVALTILCLSRLTIAESWNNLTHGKIVACSALTQSVLDNNENLFKYNSTDWTLCTHLVVSDDTLIDMKGIFIIKAPL